MMTQPLTNIATAVERSGNGKIGNASATSVAQVSCPPKCPRYHAGCYAESGPQGMYVTSKLNKAAANSTATALDAAEAEANAIAKLTGRRPLRLHVVGDCASNTTAKLVSTAAKEHTQKHNQPAWTYTHGWRETQRKNWQTVSVLASVEHPDEIQQARAKGYATAIVVPAFESTKRYALANGEQVIPCPQQTGKAENCTACKLCFNDQYLHQSKLTIAFEVHGTGKRKALAAISAGQGKTEQLIQIAMKGKN